MIATLLAAAAQADNADMAMHGSPFGIGDGTVIMWSLVWVLLPIGILALLSLIWATKNGQFRDAQEIAERQLDYED